METPLHDFHITGDPRPDLMGPADAQRLYEDDVGKDKGFLGVPTLINYPLPFQGQDGREAVPNCYCGYGVPASQLGS